MPFAHQHRRGRAARLDAGFDDVALGAAVGIRLQLEQFGLEQNHFQQLVDALFRQCGNVHENRVAAPIVRHQPLVLQLLADFQGIGVGMVNFVDRHQNGNFGRLRVIEGFEGLRHDAVVGGHHEHDEVGDVRAAGAHGTERRVAGRVEERDLRQLVFALRMRHGNRVSADVLGDAAGLARRDVGLADDVQQRGFAVVNVAHDGHDRRARLELFRLVLDVEFDLLDGCMDRAAAALALFHLETETVFGAELLRDFFVNGLVDVGEDTEFHQIGDDLERLLLELHGQFAHDNRRLDDNDFAGLRRDKFGRRRGGRAGCSGGGFRCCGCDAAVCPIW